MQKYKKSTEFFVCFGPVVCYNNQLGGKKRKNGFPILNHYLYLMCGTL